MVEWWAAALAGIAGAAVKWLIDRRRTSGQVKTTEADRLWKEAEGFRNDLREELRAKVRECKEEMLDFERQNLELRIENHELRAEVMKLQFLTHPAIPKDVKDDFLRRQRAHVKKLREVYEVVRMKEADFHEGLSEPRLP